MEAKALDCQEFIKSYQGDAWQFHLSSRYTQVHINHVARANALTADMLSDFSAFLSCVHQNPCSPILLLTSSGSSFCAGLDLKSAVRDYHERPDSIRDLSFLVGEVMDKLWTLPVAVHVVVTGHVMGGGCGFLACADKVWVKAGVRIACPEYALGLLPIQIAPYIREKIGEPGMRRFLDPQKDYTLLDLKTWGLIDEVVPDLTYEWMLESEKYEDVTIQAQNVTKRLLRTPIVEKRFINQSAKAFANAWALASNAGRLDRFRTG